MTEATDTPPPEKAATKLAARLKKQGPKAAMAVLRRVLPKSLTGDRIYNYVDFVLKQRRLPRRRMLFNDYLLRLQMSGEMLSLPRQLVSDKELCKAYVDDRIGPGRTIPTIRVIRTADEITEDAFPESCVIKATHLSGVTVIRRRGEPLPLDRIRSFLKGSLYLRTREQNYKFLEPKIIVEPIVFGGDMMELKVHCYRGQARVFSVHPKGTDGNTLERLDRSWTRMALKQRTPLPASPTPRPPCLDAILAAADRLAQDFNYIRVDAYVSGDAWLIGELTNCHLNLAWRFADLEQERLFSRALFGRDAD
ncbi:MAG: ATP-grasp fold amidoligase family protein [Pseudomonadota bacterium]